jgi:hypothetical protein
MRLLLLPLLLLLIKHDSSSSSRYAQQARNQYLRTDRVSVVTMMMSARAGIGYESGFVFIRSLICFELYLLLYGAKGFLTVSCLF